MFTVIWIENGMDKWERFDDEEEIKEFLINLKENKGVCEADVWVFSPEADNYAYEYQMFMDRF